MIPQNPKEEKKIKKNISNMEKETKENEALFSIKKNEKENYSESKKSKDSTFLIEKVKKINKWTKEEDQKLLKLIVPKKLNWKEVASNFQQKSYVQCYNRYQRIGRSFSKGSWSKAEDEQLLRSFLTFGRRWNLIAKDMGNCRTSKQIRDRYMNTLNPKLNKKNFTKVEEKTLLSCFEKFGKSWTKISSIFPGRTGEMIKNKFFSMDKKKKINLPSAISTNKEDMDKLSQGK